MSPRKSFSDEPVEAITPPDPPVTIPATSPSYASVAATTPAIPVQLFPPSSTPPRNPPAHRPKVPVKDTVRLICRFGGMHPVIRAWPPTEPFRHLSHALSLSPSLTSTTLLGAHWNRSGNLVVSFPHGTSDSVLSAITPTIRSVLELPSQTVISRDTPWAKYMVSSVPARADAKSPVHPEADVMASFLLNPAIKDLKITRSPRWIRNPASIIGAHSSFTFSFEDPDGSVSRSLAKSHLFIFGAPVHLKRWTDKPLAKRSQTQKMGPSGPAPNPGPQDLEE
ncbi:hypothetical protein FRC07_005406 [Ceratobasidium sp. 392]|nr:hypothetical protein FRC07_005406 [Ceratobasidium sp. 392]